MDPVICSFYTSEYVHLAKRMKKSALSFGFDVYIEPIEKINGRWIDTIYYRADFIKSMLNNFDRPVVWLDSDAVIERDPILFRNFQGDFGAHVHDFRWKKNEILGGTMYFANNERVHKFVDSWIFHNMTQPKQKLSQWIIPEALKDVPELKFVCLPAQYCQIFDLMNNCGEPIISHHQASRRFRNA